MEGRNSDGLMLVQHCAQSESNIYAMIHLNKEAGRSFYFFLFSCFHHKIQKKNFHLTNPLEFSIFFVAFKMIAVCGAYNTLLNCFYSIKGNFCVCVCVSVCYREEWTIITVRWLCLIGKQSFYFKIEDSQKVIDPIILKPQFLETQEPWI